MCSQWKMKEPVDRPVVGGLNRCVGVCGDEVRRAVWSSSNVGLNYLHLVQLILTSAVASYPTLDLGREFIRRQFFYHLWILTQDGASSISSKQMGHLSEGARRPKAPWDPFKRGRWCIYVDPGDGWDIL
ncbi:uncharacterized protein LOC112494723 [Cephus cinctus]|uniref:Uncharacterized protein LOC112494723 n=1 Tax=Cephus cinctus TaxID=211228 RepID=A0AAJ7RLY8_CEPCN|nr:uncharacterized protein LOC112494723 [Cephus cinctus]